MVKITKGTWRKNGVEVIILMVKEGSMKSI